MAIKSVQNYSVQNSGLRNLPLPTVTTVTPTPWTRNPAWLPMTGFNYSFDSTFSLGFGFDNDVNNIKIQLDGKILVAGNFTLYNLVQSYYRIARLNSDGTPDSTFTTNSGTGFDQVVSVLAIQTDGKILCGGAFSTYNGTTRAKIARLNADGTLDTSFNPGTGFNGNVVNIKLQSDGKIICCGLFTSFNGTTSNYIARLNSDGSLDSSFNVGTGFSGITGYAVGIAIQSDGKVLVTGYFTSYNGTTSNRIVRLNTNGSIDTSFSIGTGFNNQTDGIDIHADGKIVIVGLFTTYNGVTSNGIVRLNLDGSIDTGFKTGTGFDFNNMYDVLIQLDGKILIGGGFTTYNGRTQNSLIRLNYDGTYDTTFSTGYSSGQVKSIAVQNDTKILVGGDFTSYQGITRNRLVRLNVTEEKIVILKAVYPQSDFAAFVCSGNYTVNWGDGNTISYTSNTQADKQYFFTEANLANTNGNVTFLDSGDWVVRSNHGYVNTNTISFANISTTTGITVDTPYYVIDANVDYFRLSNTSGGSAVTLTTDGSGFILPYKQVLITITAQAGANLTRTLLNVKNSTINSIYESGFLDIAISVPNVSVTSNFSLGSRKLEDSTANVTLNQCESVSILNYGTITSGAYLFNEMHSFENVSLFDTSQITSMASMFRFCSSLPSVPLFNTANVTNMYGMFASCYSLQSVPLFNTANVTSMSTMFDSSYSLQSVPEFNTANVTNMTYMFYQCYSLQSVPLFNTAAVTNMFAMFYYCGSLTSVPPFDTAKVTSMSSMFINCNSLQSVPLFNTAAVTDMSSMFNSCFSLQTVPLFNTAKVTNMSFMFTSCMSLQSVPLFNTASVTSMYNMFQSCFSLKSVPLFNTVNVTGMYGMLNACMSLQSVPLFNTAKVTDMSYMLDSCYSLQSVPLFNTANVTSMQGTLASCRSLQSVPLFNTANVTEMNGMFQNCTALQSVPELDTGKVTNMNYMFYGCSSLTSVPLLNTANVTTMNSMFAECTSLESVPLFNTAKVTVMNNMFQNCTALQSVPKFNTANVITMPVMFYQCYSLQSVPLFNTANVTNMNDMFYGCQSLKEIPAFVCNSVTSATNFAAYSGVSRSLVSNMQASHSYLNSALGNVELNEIYTNLPTVTSKTITVTGNWGTATDDPTIATAKGWTVTG